MSVVINASTTSGLVMTSDLSGNLQFQNNGVNLPMGGVAPAFSAYQNADQTISSGVYTKVTINTKNFDTNNNFDATTNYRFTPTVAGYYLISVATSNGSSTGFTSLATAIYKNGNVWQYGNYSQVATQVNATQTSLVYCNGSTDYIEFYVYITAATTAKTLSGAATTWMSGCLVRGA